MSGDEKFYTIKAMNQFGGGFVKALAEAYMRADGSNSAKIEAAFPEIMREYGPESDFYKHVRAA